MNKIISILKMQFLNDFSGGKSHGRSRRWQLFFPVIIMIAFIPTLAVVFDVIYRSYQTLGKQAEILTLAYTILLFLGVMTCIGLIPSIVIYSKDRELLGSMPVHAREIMTAKIGQLYLYFTVVSLYFMIFPLSQYASEFGMKYLLTGLLLTLFIGWIPIFVAALIVSPFIGIFKHPKVRYAMLIFSNLMFIAITIGINYFSNVVMNGKNISVVEGGRMAIFQKATLLDLPSLLLVIGLSIFALVGALYVLSHLYKKVASSLSLISSKGQSKKKLSFRQSSPTRAIIRRHFKMIFSIPIFTLSVVINPLTPLIMIVIFMFSDTGLLEKIKQVNVLPVQFQVLVVFVACISVIVFESIAISSLTLEGFCLWENKSWPQSYEKIIRARLLAILLTIMPFALAYLLVVGVAWLSISWWLLVFVALSTLLLAVGISSLELLINIYRPINQWSNPNGAIKNNMNQILMTFSKMVIIGLMILGLFSVIGHDIFYYLMFGVSIIIGVGGYATLHHFGPQAYHNMVA